MFLSATYLFRRVFGGQADRYVGASLFEIGRGWRGALDS